ncbi:MAG: M24 family metallopeptidase [Candidatus Hodarchaeota archaeon]
MIQDFDGELSKAGIDAIVVIGDSTYENPSLAYVIGAVAARGGIYIKNVRREPTLIVADIDVGTAKQGYVKDIRSYSEFGYLELAEKLGRSKARMEVGVRALKELDIKGNIAIAGKVEAGVALSWAKWLEKSGFSISIDEELIDRVRMTKDDIEIEKIRSVGRRTEKVMGATLSMLSERQVDKDNRLKTEEGNDLTVGDVKAFIRVKLAEENLIASEDTIFAVGHEGADPHNTGGEDTVLKTNTPIVFDIFPQEVGGYCFDTTRTFVIGKASEKAKRIHMDVLESQQLALDIIKSGIPSNEAMLKVCEFFEAKGYKTPVYYTEKKIPMTEGFIHGLGHGVGLTIGEPPYLGLTSRDILAEGAITTVEPGLYFPDEFGVRIEDVVIVRKNRITNMSTFHKELEI